MCSMFSQAYIRNGGYGDSLLTEDIQRKEKKSCEYCGKMTTGKVDACDGGTYPCCRECKSELCYHEHDTETGECLI